MIEFNEWLVKTVQWEQHLHYLYFDELWQKRQTKKKFSYSLNENDFLNECKKYKIYNKPLNDYIDCSLLFSYLFTKIIQRVDASSNSNYSIKIPKLTQFDANVQYIMEFNHCIGNVPKMLHYVKRFLL